MELLNTADSPTLPQPLACGVERSTAERILDAAEAAFASDGYYAATIRGITRLAGVELSLSRYHFGSKDELFRQVVMRRADDICGMLDGSLDRAVGKAGGAGVDAIVEAMVSPAIECLSSGDPAWRNYLRLLSYLGGLNGRPDLLEPWRARYAPTVAAYKHALRRAVQAEFPQANPDAVDWGMHFLQCLLGHSLLDVGTVRYLSDASDAPVDWVALRCHLVWHVAGGLRAQCAGGAQHDRP